jgi:tRNA (uracil-5-)-methyltransferase
MDKSGSNVDSNSSSKEPAAEAAKADKLSSVTTTMMEEEKTGVADNAKPTKEEEPASTTTTTNNSDNRHWDQTNQKVVVHNVLKFLRPKEVTKLTKEWLQNKEHLNIKIINTKKPPKDNWIKVTLEDESMVDPFIQLINTGGVDGKAMTNARGGNLFAKRASEIGRNDNHRGDGGGGGDNNNRKRKDRDGDDNNDNDTLQNSKKRAATAASIRILSTDEVRDAITPLWRLPYQEQLNVKSKEVIHKCAMKIIKEIKGKFRILEQEAKRGQRGKCPKVYDWVGEKRAIEMEDVVASPRLFEYRNKCEFTCGYRHSKVEEAEAGGKDGGVDGDGEKEKSVDGAATTDVAKEEDEVTPPPTAAAAETIQKTPAAGFLAQGWSGGVYLPHCLQNMPDWSCGLADIFNEFLATSSIPPYESKLHRGIWRTITLRCSLRTRECMVIVVHAPAGGGVGARDCGSDDYSTVFESEKQRLVDMLTKDVIPTPSRDFPEGYQKEEEEMSDGAGIKVTSIFFQEYVGLSNPPPEHPVQHIYGKTSLEERLGKCTFQISPGAFFQTNTRGAEVLYDIVVNRIKEVTKNPQDTLLVDVCCGTGTIGLTCLKEGVVGKLLGVDISEPAIADAVVNATKNGYTDSETTRFVASPAEKVLPDEMKNIPKSCPVVAVVDPARDGLHGIVIRTLRSNERIQRLVYVSCNPTGTLARDAAMLCSPPTKKYPGRPFKPTMSQPVDMFPSTKHCEMVMTFDRMSEEEYEQYHGKE